MRKLIYHTVYRISGIFLIILTVATAMAQNPIQHIVVDQCDTMEFSVTSRPSIEETHFVWAIYNSSPTPTDILDPAGALDPALYFVDGMYAGRKVKVTGLEPGKYYVRIELWDEISCTNNVEMYVLEVLETIPDVELYGDEACIGEATTVKIVFTGIGPYKFEYAYGDAITGNVVNMNGEVDGPEAIIQILDPLPEGITTFWILSIDDGCKAYEFPVDERPETGIRIYPKPTNSRIYVKDK
jgi:hypothetical protein